MPQSSAKDEVNKTVPTDDSLTDGNVIIKQLNKQDWSDENVKKITKEGRIDAFRILCNSMLKEQSCSICPRRYMYNIIFSKEIDLELAKKLRLLCTRQQIKKLFEKEVIL